MLPPFRLFKPGRTSAGLPRSRHPGVRRRVTARLSAPSRLLIAFPLTALRIPLAWGLAVGLGWGVVGVWVAIAITTLLKGVALRLAFARADLEGIADGFAADG